MYICFLSVPRDLQPDRLSAGPSPPVTIAISDQCCRTIRSARHTPNQRDSAKPRNTHKTSASVIKSARRHPEAVKWSDPVTGELSSESLPANMGHLYGIPILPKQMTVCLRAPIGGAQSPAHCNTCCSHTEHTKRAAIIISIDWH